jgi:hypothetical protein
VSPDTFPQGLEARDYSLADPSEVIGRKAHLGQVRFCVFVPGKKGCLSPTSDWGAAIRAHIVEDHARATSISFHNRNDDPKFAPNAIIHFRHS